MAYRFSILFLVLSSAVNASPPLVADETVSFARDVMPVLSRGGCNNGGCHGHRDGKGGLNLSLWGESPTRDFRALTVRGSIVDLEKPGRSRLLRKPTMQSQHGGKKRFDVDSRDYEILLRWIESGAKNDVPNAPTLESLRISPESETLTEPARDVPLKVVAMFSDGERRDVTYWSVYSLSNFVGEVNAEGSLHFLKPGETTVTARYLDKRVSARLALIPNRPHFVWRGTRGANYIDEHVFRKLERFRQNPADVCDDATFVRRIHLDIIGALPAAEKARSFIQNTSPDKRERLVDHLLTRAEYAEFWALKWSDLLRNEEKVLDRKGVKVFHDWIRDHLADGRGLHLFVRNLLMSRGSTYQNPPANFYRALRNPAERAEATAQVFLGARLRCAKCHNHPFDRWTQSEYYEFAALFDGIQYEIVENKRRDKFDKNQFVGEQLVKLVDVRQFMDPRSSRPPTPRLLGRESPPLDEKIDRFEQLARWITAPENKRFARVQANRIWFNMMGSGLVEPVDDFRASNPPSHPALLDALAEELVDNDYDVRALIRRIAASRTYQLSSQANEADTPDNRNYASASTSRLPAEVLLDAVHTSLGVAPRFKRYNDVQRATALPGIEGPWLDKKPHHDDRFLRIFGKPPRLLSSDAERLNDTSLAQVFELTSGETLSSLLEKDGNRLDELLDDERGDVHILESLFWTTVTRPPTEEERAVMLRLLSEARSRADKRGALQDIAWALVNSKEFMFRH